VGLRAWSDDSWDPLLALIASIVPLFSGSPGDADARSQTRSEKHQFVCLPVMSLKNKGSASVEAVDQSKQSKPIIYLNFSHLTYDVASTIILLVAYKHLILSDLLVEAAGVGLLRCIENKEVVDFYVR
jgi:hypothetical protein